MCKHTSITCCIPKHMNIYTYNIYIKYIFVFLDLEHRNIVYLTITVDGNRPVWE